MGGKLQVKSQEGKGSTFYFYVSFDIDNNYNVSDADLQISDEKIQNKNVKILVAEDNPINQKLISKLLEKLELKAEIVNNGEECFEKFKTNKFNIILMDCQMPIMDGYLATKNIREYEKEQKLTRLPIIALTANAIAGTKEMLIEEVGILLKILKS